MTLLLSLVLVSVKVVVDLQPPLVQQLVIELFGMQPSRLLGDGFPVPALTALFLHSGWLHLAGNLAYLWVFGIPVERRLGAAGLLLAFLAGGALANVVVALRLPGVEAFVIGASGAVSAVLGTYFGLFPTRRIGLYLPLGLYFQFAQLPGLLVIGSWFILQLVYTVVDPNSGSIAWWTHLAGFTLGIMFALLARALAQIRIP